MPVEAASRRQVALFPNLRAHRLAALCGVRAHVQKVRSARQAYSAEVSYEGREGLRPCWTNFFEHSHPTDGVRPIMGLYWLLK
jgi:hypothetical protein